MYDFFLRNLNKKQNFIAISRLKSRHYSENLAVSLDLNFVC